MWCWMRTSCRMWSVRAYYHFLFCDQNLALNLFQGLGLIWQSPMRISNGPARQSSVKANFVLPVITGNFRGWKSMLLIGNGWAVLTTSRTRISVPVRIVTCPLPYQSGTHFLSNEEHVLKRIKSFA